MSTATRPVAIKSLAAASLFANVFNLLGVHLSLAYGQAANANYLFVKTELF
jgi:hypothetical protein